MQKKEWSLNEALKVPLKWVGPNELARPISWVQDPFQGHFQDPRTRMTAATERGSGFA